MFLGWRLIENPIYQGIVDLAAWLGALKTSQMNILFRK
jgi:hypothetical protein